MTDLERARAIIDMFPVQEEFDAKACLIEEVAEAFSIVREEERALCAAEVETEAKYWPTTDDVQLPMAAAVRRLRASPTA